LLWRATVGENLLSDPKPAYGSVYVGGSDWRVFCLNAATGGEEWFFEYRDDITSDPCVEAGKVIIASNYWLLCLDAGDGRLLWKHCAHGRIECNPAAAAGKVYFHWGSGSISCIDANNGNELWTSEFIQTDRFGGAPCLHDGRIYIGGRRAAFCLNAGSGDLIWDTPFVDEYGSIMACVDGNRVFFPLSACDPEVFDLLTCYDVSSGRLLWTHNFGYHRGISGAAVWDGKVYVNGGGADPFCTRCFDGTSGEILWEAHTGASRISDPCVAAGKVFTWNDDTTVVCVDAESGKRLWQYEIPAKGRIRYLHGNPAYEEGRLFLGTGGPDIYCLKAD
jgi:outer membrane protein assembly factor BamB